MKKKRKFIVKHNTQKNSFFAITIAMFFDVYIIGSGSC